MDCKGLKQHVHDYFTGELEAAIRAELEAHAESCSECGEFMRVCREITCKEVNEFLYLYVEDLLDEARRGVFERHLAICGDCANYLETYRETIRLIRASFEGRRLGLPAEVPPDLVRAVFETCRLKR